MNKSELFRNAHALAKSWGKANGHYYVRFSIALKIGWAEMRTYPKIKTNIKIIGYIDVDALKQRDLAIKKARRVEKLRVRFGSNNHILSSAMKLAMKAMDRKRFKLQQLRRSVAKPVKWQIEHNQLANKLNKKINK